MDKLAIIADLHGNIPAVEAVLADIEQRNIQKLYVLGDLVGKGPYSDKTVDLIRSLDATVIRGNWDDSFRKEINDPLFQWYVQQLGPERIEYLINLPVNTQFYLSGRLVRLFHSSQDSLYHRVYPMSPVEELASMFENHELVGGLEGPTPEIVGYADIHHAFITTIKGKILFNTGSVGNSLDINEPSYVILEGRYGSTEKSSYSINFVRVPYDIEAAVRQAEESGMPYLAEFVNELRTARYRGRKD